MIDLLSSHTCTHCHESKPAYEFAKDKRTKTGLDPRCLECKAEVNQFDNAVSARLQQLSPNHRPYDLPRSVRLILRGHATTFVEALAEGGLRDYIEGARKAHRRANKEYLPRMVRRPRPEENPPEPARERSGFVYFIRHKAFPGQVSIGHTEDVRKRLGAYNRAVPDRGFEVVGWISTPDRFATERRIHQALDEHRTRVKGKQTEWFNFDADEALALGKMMFEEPLPLGSFIYD